MVFQMRLIGLARPVCLSFVLVRLSFTAVVSKAFVDVGSLRSTIFCCVLPFFVDQAQFLVDRTLFFVDEPRFLVDLPYFLLTSPNF
jgi:hypothetical protein